MKKNEEYYKRLDNAANAMIAKINNGTEYEIPDLVSNLSMKFEVEYEDLMDLYDKSY